jgi:hypothetical protein
MKELIMSDTKFPDQIQERIDAGRNCGSWIGNGWMDLVVQLDEQVAQLDPDYVIDQVKEKFGGLRYYISISEGVDQETCEKIWSIIHEVEDKSFDTCDMCGQPGKRLNVNGSGYIATRCEQHKDTTG